MRKRKQRVLRAVPGVRLVAQFERGKFGLGLGERLEKLLHGIMLHRAHHYDPFVPNYRLKAATQRLMAHGVASAKATVAGWKYLRELSRKCALYDYNAKAWLSFPQREALPATA